MEQNPEPRLDEHLDLRLDAKTYMSIGSLYPFAHLSPLEEIVLLRLEDGGMVFQKRTPRCYF